MQRMWICKAEFSRVDGNVCFTRSRRVGRLNPLRGWRRNRPVMKYSPQGLKGGSVEPPCDFQKQSSVSPVFIGLPP